MATAFGKFEVGGSHCLAFASTPLSASPYLQGLSCLAGRQLVFGDAPEMSKFIGGVEITAKQVERICHYHGGQIGKDKSRARLTLATDRPITLWQAAACI